MNAQVSIFEITPRELVRMSDPETSHQAARGDRVASRVRLLRAFYGVNLTSEEAAHRSGLDPWQASKRVSDLLRLGYVVPTGELRTGSSGRQQRVLAITTEGKGALA